jgi:hypothetical protein
MVLKKGYTLVSVWRGSLSSSGSSMVPGEGLSNVGARMTSRVKLLGDKPKIVEVKPPFRGFFGSCIFFGEAPH